MGFKNMMKTNMAEFQGTNRLYNIFQYGNGLKKSNLWMSFFHLIIQI